MAAELQIAFTMTLSKPSTNLARSWQFAKAIDVASTGGIFDAPQTIGFAAHELLVVPADVGTYSIGGIWNMDPTNFVQIGLDVGAAFYPTDYLKPLEAIPKAWVPGVSYYAKADTGSVKIAFLIIPR